MSRDERIPVIVGLGEINDRPGEGEDGLDAVQLMAEAARAADSDAGGGWLARCDWLAITPQISFRALDPVALLPGMLGIAPARTFENVMANGDTPVLHLSMAANAIGAGEASVCLLTGGEALRTAARRPASGEGDGIFQGSLRTASDLRRRYGLITPSELYPLYENACRAAWGQTLAEGQAESGQIWAAMSRVALTADGAWIKRERTAAEIVEVTLDNRPIAFPYTKLQVANSSVNQGAALIVTSLARARAAGIPDERLVYVGAGAAAHEADDPLARAEWTGTPSMAVVLEQALAQNGLTPAQLDHVELYSCFPCVPKMARRVLGLGVDRPLTVHGGLTFGGGPIGNYMMHAAAAMVRKLRREGRFGLLYGNGGHCTHNHAVVLSAQPVEGVSFPQDFDFQQLADARRGPVLEIDDSYEGPAMLETYTVIYARDGSPLHGIVLARAPDGGRIAAKVDGGDAEGIAFLTDGTAEPVGSRGRTVRIGETLHWRHDG